jgi:EamA domain-containing membrane protein RarD
MHGSGILVFLCFVGAGVVAFLGDQTKSLDKTFWFIALACGGIATLITVINFLRALDAISYYSFGFYLAVAASIAVLVSAYMFRSPGDSIKGGFDSLKSDIEKKTDGNPNT